VPQPACPHPRLSHRAVRAGAKKTFSEITVWLVDDAAATVPPRRWPKLFRKYDKSRARGIYFERRNGPAGSRRSISKPDAFLWLNDDVVLLPKRSPPCRMWPTKIRTQWCGIVPFVQKRRAHVWRRAASRTSSWKDSSDHAHRCPDPVRHFEGNIVWVPASTFERIRTHGGFPARDGRYRLRLPCFGLRHPVLIAPGFLGLCAANSRRGTWEDTNLNMSERLKKLRSIKGLPAGDWWRFCRRNGGWAPHSILSLRSSACWRVGNEQDFSFS